MEKKTGLYAHGEFNDYGDYLIICAESMEEANKIAQNETFPEFKKDLYSEKDVYESLLKQMDNGEFNGYKGWDKQYLRFEKMGYYKMDDAELFEAYCKNEFKPVTDLKTNVWHGENA